MLDELLAKVYKASVLWMITAGSEIVILVSVADPFETFT